MTRAMWNAGCAGFCLAILYGTLVSVPLTSSVPQCTEDEVVVTETYLWVHVPDKCMNREDAQYEYGYWVAPSD